jgi:hypothetical protein
MTSCQAAQDRQQALPRLIAFARCDIMPRAEALAGDGENR